MNSEDGKPTGAARDSERSDADSGVVEPTTRMRRAAPVYGCQLCGLPYSKHFEQKHVFFGYAFPRSKEDGR